MLHTPAGTHSNITVHAQVKTTKVHITQLLALGRLIDHFCPVLPGVTGYTQDIMFLNDLYFDQGLF